MKNYTRSMKPGSGKIIDVSSHNGAINWDEAKNDGVSDVIVRLSMGYNTKDENAGTNANGAAKAGIRVSYYHFAYPDKKTGGTVDADARNEARYFTGLFNGIMPAPYWLALDLEKWGPGKDSPLNQVEYLQWVTVFLHEVHKVTDTICMIYSNRPYLNDRLPANHGLGGVPLWIANYNNVSKPPLPVGWNCYYLWQYTDKGKVKGVTSNCDMSKSGFEVSLTGMIASFEASENKKKSRRSG